MTMIEALTKDINLFREDWVYLEKKIYGLHGELDEQHQEFVKYLKPFISFLEVNEDEIN